MAVKNIAIAIKNPDKTSISQDDRIKNITSSRLKRILLNNTNHLIPYSEIVKFLDEKIDFGKYRANAVQDFIRSDTIDNISQVMNLTNFDKSAKLSDFYDFSGDVIKIKDDIRRSMSKKREAVTLIAAIIKNNETHQARNVFMTREEGFTWKEILKEDPAYLGKMIDIYDFSDPFKNKQLFKYYTNKNNVEGVLEGELTEQEVDKFLPKKMNLSSFEIDIGGKVSFDAIVKKFKDKGMVFFDTETTGFDPTTGSLLSFGWVKIEWNEQAKTFEKTKSGEIFIKELKEPVSDFTAYGGVFGKYEGNKITERVLREKGLSPYDAIREINNVLGDSYALAHNASFDLSYITTFFNDLKTVLPKPLAVYDTYSEVFPILFQKIPEFREISKLSLDSIAEKVLGIDVKSSAERHTALKDALWSADIIIKLIQNTGLSEGTKSNKDFEVMTLF